MTLLSVPTIDVEGPAGRRVTVAPRSGDDHVGELADALGVDRHRPLLLDGRAVGRGDTLRGAGVVNGSRIDAVAPPDERPVTSAASRPPAEAAAVVTVIAEAGPATGAVVHLPPGRHVVGRSPSAAVALADRALEPHHALLEVDDDGTVRFIQLSGRVTGRIGAEPVTSPAAVPDGGVLLLGASRLRVGRERGPGHRVGGAHGDAGGPVAADVAADAAATSAVGAGTDPRAGSGRPGGAAERRRPADRGDDPAGVGRSRGRHALADVPPVRRRRGRRLGRHVDRRPDRRRPRRPPERRSPRSRRRRLRRRPSRSSGQLARRTISPSTPPSPRRSAPAPPCAAMCGHGGSTTTTPSASRWAGVRWTGTSSSTPAAGRSRRSWPASSPSPGDSTTPPCRPTSVRVRRWRSVERAPVPWFVR